MCTLIQRGFVFSPMLLTAGGVDWQRKVNHSDPSYTETLPTSPPFVPPPVWRALRRTMAFEKIKVANPIVEMDGERLLRFLYRLCLAPVTAASIIHCLKHLVSSDPSDLCSWSLGFGFVLPFTSVDWSRWVCVLGLVFELDLVWIFGFL